MKMDESNNLGEELKGAALKKGDKFYIKNCGSLYLRYLFVKNVKQIILLFIFEVFHQSLQREVLLQLI